MFGLSKPSLMMSNDCSSGTPAAIMVDIWRVNRAMSIGLIFFPAPSREMPFLRTLTGVMPCLRSCALTRVGFWLDSSPLTLVPFLSVPSHTKTLVFNALSAMG